jgi:hypothetical protein
MANAKLPGWKAAYRLRHREDWSEAPREWRAEETEQGEDWDAISLFSKLVSTNEPPAHLTPADVRLKIHFVDLRLYK